METRNILKLLPLLLLGALAACEQPSRVQNRYATVQEDCRTAAENYVAQMPNAANLTPDQQTAETVNQFSNCMNKSGWPVSNPLKVKAAKAAAAAAAAAQVAKTPPPVAAQSPTPAPNAPAQYQPITPTEPAPGRQF